jgi:hypothetical protein
MTDRWVTLLLRVAFALAVGAALPLSGLPLAHDLDVFAGIVLAVLSVPVGLAGLALARPSATTSCVVGVVLTVGGFLLATLLGLFFVPSGVLLLVAARRQARLAIASRQYAA